MGLGAVTILVGTGVYAAWQQVGGVPALLGTAYGRWLLVKLALFGALLPLAARNLLVWRRRLAATGSGAPEAAVTALRGNVFLEAGLVAAILVVVAVIGLTTPAQHDEIAWPLSFRFDWAATKTLPGVQPRVAIGSQVATLGLVALLLSLVIRPRRWRVAALGGGLALALGAALALHPLAVDANPATYVRPAVPYSAASIVQGEGLYRTHCQGCHGVAGYGDGPARAGLPRPPADLTAQHAADHTAGDLFWWLTRGIPGSGMPGFADQLTPEARWDVINFVRALGAAERSRDLGPIATMRPAAVAPDFTFTTGVGEGRALRDWRGRGIVLLVFFTLPDSADRLVELNRLAAATEAARGRDPGRAARGPGRRLPRSRRPARVLPDRDRRRGGGGRRLHAVPARPDGRGAQAGAAAGPAHGASRRPPGLPEGPLDPAGSRAARRRAGATWDRFSPRSTGWRARSRSPPWRPSTCIERRRAFAGDAA